MASPSVVFVMNIFDQSQRSKNLLILPPGRLWNFALSLDAKKKGFTPDHV